MISPAELTSMRAMMAQTMTATATILRKAQVADTSGGFIDTFTSVGTSPCAFMKSQVNALERERDVRIQAIAYWVFRFPTGTDVRLTDRLLVGARTFEVSGAGEVSHPLELTVQAQEIT